MTEETVDLLRDEEGDNAPDPTTGGSFAVRKNAPKTGHGHGAPAPAR